MEPFLDIVFPILGIFIGGMGIAWLYRDRARQAAKQAKDAGESERLILTSQLEEARRRITELSAEVSKRDASLAAGQKELTEEVGKRCAAEESAKQERKGGEEKLALLNEARQKLADTFSALSHEALESNNRSFLDLAKTALEKFQEGAKGDLEKRQHAIDELMNPVKSSLEEFKKGMQELETARTGAYADIKRQITSMAETERQLRGETANLVQALRSPVVRGRWGEIQLRRVVELAGMLNHCDFFEQESVQTEEGRLRPDLLVRLPANKNIVVDAKVPLSSYLEAIETSDDTERKLKMQGHARQIRDHIAALSKKSYWEQFKPAPEFVVLFLPGESFFSAALQQDPSLIEVGPDQGIILATPTTLIALLRAVHYGWRQENLAKNAKVISDLGRELYERISTMGTHMLALGKSLGGSVEAYNKAVGSLEARVLVSARRFKDLEAANSGDEITPLLPLEQSPRLPQAQELLALPDEEKNSEDG